MKNIRVLSTFSEYDEYTEDISKIVRAFSEHALVCTREQARDMWAMYSESEAAGWLTICETDDEIVGACIPYFEEV